MQKELYREYELLEMQFKELEKKRDDLRARILTDMIADNHKQVETDFGKFTVGRKITWKYTDLITKMEEKVKIKKLYQQERGLAKPEQNSFLLYKTKTN